MKVLGILGSPHEHRPSSTVAREVLRGAAEAGHEVKIYALKEMNVRGCQACGYCKAHWCDCVLEDDLKPYWKDLQECGALVLAAPNYCGQIAGPMITYMNRHYCLMMMADGKGIPRIHPGIQVVGVFSQGNADPDAYRKAYDWYLHDFEARGMQVKDVLIHTSQTPCGEGSELMRRAYEDGKRL